MSMPPESTGKLRRSPEGVRRRGLYLDEEVSKLDSWYWHPCILVGHSEICLIIPKTKFPSWTVLAVGLAGWLPIFLLPASDNQNFEMVGERLLESLWKAVAGLSSSPR